MKKWTALLLSAVVVLSLAACGTKGTESSQPEGSSSSAGEPTGSTQLANPFVDCETLAEAANLAGFTITAPETISEVYEAPSIRAMENEMIELIYPSAGGEQEVRIRKAIGAEDISGDYNAYAETSALKLDGLEATVKGDDGVIYTAIWTDGTYAYSIHISDGATVDEMAALIQTVG